MYCMRFCSGTICFFNVIYDKRKVKHTNMHIEILNISDWYSWKFGHFNLMYKLKGVFVKGGGGGWSNHPRPRYKQCDHSCRLRNKEFDLRHGLRSGLKKGSIIAFKRHLSYSLVVNISKRVWKIWEYKEDIWMNYISVFFKLSIQFITLICTTYKST